MPAFIICDGIKPAWNFIAGDCSYYNFFKRKIMKILQVHGNILNVE